MGAREDHPDKFFEVHKTDDCDVSFVKQEFDDISDNLVESQEKLHEVLRGSIIQTENTLEECELEIKHENYEDCSDLCISEKNDSSSHDYSVKKAVIRKHTIKENYSSFVCGHGCVISNIYVPENARICLHHLDERGMLLNILHRALRFINKPYSITMQFLQGLRTAANSNNHRSYSDINSFSDEEYKSFTSLSRQQFQELYEVSDPVQHCGNLRNITQQHLFTFLTKLRHGISDDLLKTIFEYPSRQTTSMIISNVRMSLVRNFVPNNIGLNAITREEYIVRHVSPFANELYNSEPLNHKAIVYIDCTYNKIEKSNNFRVLRQSYCYHKHEHLVKPEVMVAPDGYILSINGPYFSDARNNDATILTRELQQDNNGIRRWIEEGDIFILDRGYRDSIPFLDEIGIRYFMPPLLRRGQRQLSTVDANRARLITNTRWIVEARNGQLKSIFKFLKNNISAQHAIHLGDFYRIAGAIINRFHPLINMRGTAEVARQMLNQSQEANFVKDRVEAENLRFRNGQWVLLNHHHVEEFPRFDLEYLIRLTGIYHVYLSASYIQDTLQREGINVFEFDELLVDHNFLRFRVYSRFRNDTKHMLWIMYNNGENVEGQPILGHYCTCKAGARTLGTCAHVASVLWFLGYARYEENIKYPSASLLKAIVDAADRDLPVNLRPGPEIMEIE